MDEGNFTTKLRRYGRVTTTLAKAGGRLAGEKVLGFEVDHAAQSKELSAVMGALKGPLMKVAQFLSTVPDALPDVYTQDFLTLQSQAPAMGWSFVKRRMVAELGANWPSLFTDFSHDASFAASLGQVHRARTLEGQEVACKLQYPQMDTTLEADLSQLRLALKIYETTLGGIKTQELLAEITQHLREELDYTREARNLGLFAQIFKDDPQIHVPQVIEGLSTKRLLTMSWMEGAHLRTLLDSPQESRNQLARVLFKAWYKPLYHYALVHGDPHLGNYTVRADGGINLLDFGCVRIFRPNFIQSTLDLYDALATNDKEKAVAAYEGWGFGTLTHELIDTLNLWAQMLYEPLLDNRVRPIQKDHRGHEGRERAAQVHQALRKLGGVTPPREFVFLDRAAVGIGSAFMHLKAELNWHQLFHELIQDFSPSQVQTRQKTLGLNQV